MLQSMVMRPQRHMDLTQVLLRFQPRPLPPPRPRQGVLVPMLSKSRIHVSRSLKSSMSRLTAFCMRTTWISTVKISTLRLARTSARLQPARRTPGRLQTLVLLWPSPTHQLLSLNFWPGTLTSILYAKMGLTSLDIKFVSGKSSSSSSLLKRT